MELVQRLGRLHAFSGKESVLIVRSVLYYCLMYQIHHTRHHQTYVSNLNSIITGDHGSAIKVGAIPSDVRCLQRRM